jgi:hypothetical protein
MPQHVTNRLLVSSLTFVQIKTGTKEGTAKEESVEEGTCECIQRIAYPRSDRLDSGI